MAGKAHTFRWTFDLASSEYGIDRRIIARRAKTAGIIAGDDGKYSTRDISKAIFGDLHGETLREKRENADKLALANQKARGELVDVPKAITFCNGIGVVIRQKLLASSLEDHEKDEMLADLLRLFDAGTVTEQICASSD